VILFILAGMLLAVYLQCAIFVCFRNQVMLDTVTEVVELQRRGDCIKLTKRTILFNFVIFSDRIL